MKKLLLLACSILFIATAYAQNPLVKQWDKRFGGTHDERLNCIRKTSDGGYILGGFSRSNISCDKSQISQGGFDYWIVKTDSLGNKQWDKNFGGLQIDQLTCLEQTDDGGYILGGSSYSGIGGDKTQMSWGGYDYWIIKIDSLGNKQWDKDFGGIYNDLLNSIYRTSDGGYILGGGSASGISGDKTEVCWGGYDYWIIKIDSVGIKQWDKTFGGTNGDVLTTMQQISDGGYILGGDSWSDSSGNKTLNSWGITDYWLVKTDSLGIKQWEKGFGGNSSEGNVSLQQTSDLGYIIGGTSWSDISGNKTQASWGEGDYWIVKIDSLGNKQWDRDFGGTGREDAFGAITLTSDGGYLLAGNSYSNLSGDKSENNLAQEQTWIIKTDSLGNKQWDKTMFTASSNNVVSFQIGFAFETSTGCYLISNHTVSGIGGYKTQTNCNPTDSTSDYWIIKFCDSTLTTSAGNINQASGFNVYPNPFDKELNVQSLKFKVEQGCAVKVYDVFGKEMYSNTHTTLNFKLQTLNWPNGIYLLEILTDKERMVRKVVKQ